jgi:hypothetical protein
VGLNQSILSSILTLTLTLMQEECKNVLHTVTLRRDKRSFKFNSDILILQIDTKV